MVDLGGKVKAPRGVVEFVGSRKDATDYLLAHNTSGKSALVVTGATVAVGDHETAVVGYGGTAVAGFEGTATAGVGGTAVAGAYGTAVVGFDGKACAGFGGELMFTKRNRKHVVFNVGENGIDPNVLYKLNDDETGVIPVPEEGA